MVIKVDAYRKDPEREFPRGGICWGIKSETKYFGLEGEKIVYDTFLTGPPPLQLMVTVGGFKRSEIYEGSLEGSLLSTSIIDVEPITDEKLIDKICSQFKSSRPIVFIDFYQPDGEQIRKVYDNRPKRDMF